MISTSECIGAVDTHGKALAGHPVWSDNTQNALWNQIQGALRFSDPESVFKKPLIIKPVYKIIPAFYNHFPGRYTRAQAQGGRHVTVRL